MTIPIASLPAPGLDDRSVSDQKTYNALLELQQVLTGAVDGTNIAAAIKDAAAATASLRTLGTGAAQAAAGNDARFSDSRAPSGAAGGDLSGTYPNPGVAKVAGKAVNKMNFGRTTVGPMTGTASAGPFHVPHGFAGTTPLAVTVTVEDPTNATILATLGTIDGTNFDVYLRDVRGLGNSNSYVVDWVAFA